jgi:SHS2 domain-containing protein
MSPYEELDHTADWSFRVRAPSCEILFTDSAKALYDMAGVQTTPEPGGLKTILLQADDWEGLFILWLNELLYILEHDCLALSDFQVEELQETRLRISGREAEVTAVGKSIKAATYSGLHITQDDDGWQATVVLDV